MRNQIEFTYDNKGAEELFYPPIRWYESGINVLTKDELSNSKRELEQLFLEAQEYDFLMGKTPQVFSDYWGEEDE